MKMSIEDILGGVDDVEYGSSDIYQTHVDQLASALGLSKEKAQKAASAICSLIRYELEEAEGDQKVTITVGS